ncbi:MAG: tRNA guanosine(34) transglycosylase Tgt [Spirochaetaceae bacterium]|nr:tRNA guanosine(34) transglycosylase Tgt [Spirochaetaceae bacterium]
MITISHQDHTCSARTGVLNLPHGDVDIPSFMPVGTNGTVKAMLHSALSDIGYDLILGNTYHLYLRPGTEVIESYGGLHQFTTWQGNILTDSGGFQVFSLAPFRKITDDGVTFRSHIDGSKHYLTPEKVVDIQTILRSDIQMQLDVCTPPDISKNDAEKALELTTMWAKKAKNRRESGPEDYQGALFGIVQGNFFKDLRRRSAQELGELDLPGYAIGGLSVGEEPEVFRDFLHYTAPYLPGDKPKYVMGIGTPDYMLEAMEAGIDLFDCVYPTRVARNGTCFTKDGMLNLKNARFKDDGNPIDPGCRCPVCARYSRGYMRHLFAAKEILGPMLVTRHNLDFLYVMMDDAREAIRNGSFLKFKSMFLERFRGKA